MTNKIKENIIIFWGGLAICLYIANSFEWIDICLWLQQIINYECNLEETTRKYIPILLTILVLIGIAKIIIVSFQLGQLSIPSARCYGRQELKLFPSLPLDEQSCSEPHEDNFTSLITPTTNERMLHIRDRHIQEQIALHQQIINSILLLILYVYTVKWYPKLSFSKHSFFYVFNYGSKLLVSSLISVVYHNMYTIVIGKKFTSYELGLYTRAEAFAIFPSNNIGSIISRAAFPLLSKFQDDKVKLVGYYKKLIKFSSFIIFPLMLGLLVVAKPFILVILSEKWIGAVPLLQILCISWMFDHLCNLNLQLLYVIGRTDLVLKLEIIKKAVAISILILSIPFGLIGMCWGLVVYIAFAVIVNTYYTNKLFEYNWISQFKDYFPYLLTSMFMTVIVFWVENLFTLPIVQLVIGILTGVAVYGILTLLFFRNIVNTIRTLIIKK